jgi:bifunctional UDP-N-acetylglucosamine pyrophosphorylase/glucosamine-1-phosphate N-acetyltransferase
MTLAVVILAAGQGTRMKSSMPKVLHPLAGWPMIKHVLSVARALDPLHTVVVLGHDMERVRTVLPDDVVCVPQEPQLGTGHAVLQARATLLGRSDTVLVLYGDTPLIRATTLRELRAIHETKGAAISLLTFFPPDVTGYGRIARKDTQGSGEIIGIVEHRDATPEQRAIREANSGILCFRASWLWPHLDRLERSPQGEYYLTDLVALAVSEREPVGSLVAEDPSEVMGVNDRCQLADAEAVLQRRLTRDLMLSGVTIRSPETVSIDMDVCIARDTIVEPYSILRGSTTVGSGCVIGPYSILQDATVEDYCQVVASVLSATTLRSGAHVGPFVNLQGETEQGT